MIDFLTSDLFVYIMIALLIVVLGFFVCCMLGYAVNNIRVSRFFARHQPSEGIVRQYDKDNGSTHFAAAPVLTGKSMYFMPRTAQTLDQYYVLLECQCSGKRFHAAYEIPVEDYKQAHIGASVKIEDHWSPVSYELL